MEIRVCLYFLAILPLALVACSQPDARDNICSNGEEQVQKANYDGALEDWRRYTIDEAPKDWFRVTQECLNEIFPHYNEENIADWLTKAAQSGSSNASILLSVVYANGIGYEKDKDRAFRFLTNAAELGNHGAKEHLKTLNTAEGAFADPEFRRDFVIASNKDAEACSNLLDDHRRAITHCNLALHSKEIDDKTASEALTNRGFHYRRLGQNDAALSDYSRSIQINPENATAYYNRSYIYEELGRLEDAKSDIENAYRLAPKSDFILKKAVEYGLLD